MSKARFEIEGGFAIQGSIRPSGNKNAALPLLSACLLTEEPVTLHNMPNIRDVAVMLGLLESLGVEIQAHANHSVTLCAKNLRSIEPPLEKCRVIRASILLAGPLLARRGHVALPPPGGDVIGRRRLDTHVLALESLGAQVDATATMLNFRTQNGLLGAEVFLDEASVTATENAIMAAALAKGETILWNAASEPHVQDLCQLIVAMGAQIDGIGTNRLIIQGASRLHGAEYTLGPDYIEVGSLITLAAVTKGELRIIGARPKEHRATKLAFSRLGIVFEASADGQDILVPKDQPLRVAADLGGAIPKIEDAPWPGFPADLTSIAVVAATQSEGTVMIHEKLFESRLFFVDWLSGMGARIVLCDPHRVVINGRNKLIAQEVVSPDIRAGMALLIAALCAEGKSIIHNVQQIDRGYEQIDVRLSALGARIKRFDE